MEVILKEDVASAGFTRRRGEGCRRLRTQLSAAAQAGDPRVQGQQGRHRADEGRRRCAARPKRRPAPKLWPSSLKACRFLSQRRAGEHDQLFGSVTSGDIADALTKKGFDIDRRKIQVHEPLKTLGEFTVPIKLHKDVTTHLKVIIEKEATE